MFGKKLSRMLALLLAGALLLTSAAPVFAGASITDIRKDTGNTGKYLCKTVSAPVIDSVGGEWAVLGLAQSGYAVPEGYFDRYYGRVAETMKEMKGELHRVKYTEYSRLILALTAIGKDVTNVGGYNLLAKLSNYDMLIKQGINGPSFALLALDAHGYDIPQATSGTQTSRDKLISYIISNEFKSGEGLLGGFALGGEVPDPDITAMTLQALAKYKDREDVKAVIDRGLTALSKAQLKSGGFTSKGAENAESAAQVVVALCTLGIDPAKDERFAKNGINVWEALSAYALSSGGYAHSKGGAADGMATEQAHLAQAAYLRLLEGKSSIYDMKNVQIQGAASMKANEIKVMLNGKEVSFDQPPVIVDGRTLVPMRAIFEAFGAKVTWDQKAQKATGTLKDKKVELTIGSKTAYINGKAKSLDVPAQILGGRTLVPLRFIAESLDTEVSWDQKSKMVTIVKGGIV